MVCANLTFNHHLHLPASFISDLSPKAEVARTLMSYPDKYCELGSSSYITSQTVLINSGVNNYSDRQPVSHREYFQINLNIQ